MTLYQPRVSQRVIGKWFPVAVYPRVWRINKDILMAAFFISSEFGADKGKLFTLLQAICHVQFRNRLFFCLWSCANAPLPPREMGFIAIPRTFPNLGTAA